MKLTGPRYTPGWDSGRRDQLSHELIKQSRAARQRAALDGRESTTLTERLAQERANLYRTDKTE